MTDKAKHTPGSWMVDPDNPEMVCILVDGVYQYLCDTSAWESEAINADARLIAAAPDTHKALKELVSAIDDLIAESDGIAGLHLNGDMAPWSELTEGGRFETWMLRLEDARQAIAKATRN